MASISIELTEEEADRLAERARHLSMRPEALAAAVVRDQLNAGDAEFDELATEIVEKNRRSPARFRAEHKKEIWPLHEKESSSKEGQRSA